MNRIQIHYTTEVISNEPGPNMLWIGPGDGFRSFIDHLYPLAKGKKRELTIETGDAFVLHGIHRVRLIQQPRFKERFIVKGRDDVAITLDKQHWRDVIHLVTSITFGPSENYIEFDEEGLREDANWMVESSE